MEQNNDPLHGVNLSMILTRLVSYFGWEKLGSHIKINCFNFYPSIKSSLKFLRRTPWARKKVESLYLDLDYAKKDKEVIPDKPIGFGYKNKWIAVKSSSKEEVAKFLNLIFPCPPSMSPGAMSPVSMR